MKEFDDDNLDDEELPDHLNTTMDIVETALHDQTLKSETEQTFRKHLKECRTCNDFFQMLILIRQQLRKNKELREFLAEEARQYFQKKGKYEIIKEIKEKSSLDQHQQYIERLIKLKNDG